MDRVAICLTERFISSAGAVYELGTILDEHSEEGGAVVVLVGGFFLVGGCVAVMVAVSSQDDSPTPPPPVIAPPPPLPRSVRRIARTQCRCKTPSSTAFGYQTWGVPRRLRMCQTTVVWACAIAKIESDDPRHHRGDVAALRRSGSTSGRIDGLVRLRRACRAGHLQLHPRHPTEADPDRRAHISRRYRLSRQFLSRQDDETDPPKRSDTSRRGRRAVPAAQLADLRFPALPNGE